MGYTHYYRLNQVNPFNFKDICNEVKIVVEEATPKTFTHWFTKKKEPLKICGGNGEGEPKFNEGYICFNGERRDDLSHESFYLDETGQREFCKTARKPYDIAVCLALLRLKDRCGEYFEYGSDGVCPMDTKDYRKLEREWKDAVKAYAEWCIKNDIPTTIIEMKNLPKMCTKQ